MYLSGSRAVEGVKHAAAGTVRGTGTTVFTLLGAVGLGFGVPLFWIWVASVAAGGSRTVTSSLALFTAIGVISTYWVLLLVGAWIRARMLARDESAPRVRRQSWNRSMRDEPFRPGHSKSDPVERIFVAAAILGFVAFEVWFAFFAGSPFGSS
jgi:hypothetical protein